MLFCSIMVLESPLEEAWHSSNAVEVFSELSHVHETHGTRDGKS